MGACPANCRKAEEQQKKRAAYDAAAREFARVLFAVSTVLGVAVILIGAALTSHTLGAGLMLGGTFSLAIGYLGYGSRFASLLAGFGALFFVGYRKL